MAKQKHAFLDTALSSCSVCFFIGIFLFSNLYSQEVFNSKYLHEIHIYTPVPLSDNWFDSLDTYYYNALNGQAHKFIPVKAEIDGETVAEVGFRFKGKYSNYGFSGKKKPFRLDFNTFNKKGEFQGLKKINLHNNAGDPSFLREYMAYGIFAHLGIPAPQISFCKLFINDVYWGCYSIVEEPDKTFLAKHFGNKTGNLFECIKNTGLEWKGNDKNLYPELELKTEEYPNSWDRLLRWIEMSNNPAGYDYQQQLSSVFDLDNFLKILAVDILINNWDSYYDNGRNFLIYDDTENALLHWIPWDYNLSFWETNPYIFPAKASTGEHKPFINTLKNHPYLREYYLENYCRLIEYQLRDFNFERHAKQTQELISEAVENDTLKFYSNDAFHKNIHEGVVVNMIRNNKPTDVWLPGLNVLYKKRKNALRNMLFAEGIDCSEIEADNKRLHCKIFPIPAREFIIIYIEEVASNQDPVNISIYDTNGKKILQQNSSLSLGSISVNTETLAPGIYYIEIQSHNLIHRQKLLIHE